MTTPAKGPIASANNLTGVTHAEVAIAGTTAQTWTHNFNARPVKVELFNQGVPVETGDVVVTTGANSITLTPSTYTATLDVLIWWKLPSELTDGVPTANFA